MENALGVRRVDDLGNDLGRARLKVLRDMMLVLNGGRREWE